MSTSTRIAAGRPWTPEEDAQLRAAVALHGENDNWKTVAEMVPGRTNKACRKRWRHSLSPGVKKTAWTAEEDKLLLDLHEKHGDKWSVIAREIEGRTDDACSKRYREALDPNLRKDEWTDEDDNRLRDLHAQLSGQWRLIGAALCRGSLACRNRWRLFERKQRRLAQLSKYEMPDFSAPATSSSSEGRYEATWVQPDVHGQATYDACDSLMAYHQEQTSQYPVQPVSFLGSWTWASPEGSIPTQHSGAHGSVDDASAIQLDQSPSSAQPSHYGTQSFDGIPDPSPYHAYWTSCATDQVYPPVPHQPTPALPLDAADNSTPCTPHPAAVTELAAEPMSLEDTCETGPSASLPERSPTFTASTLASPSSYHETVLPSLSPESNAAVDLPACDMLWGSPVSNACPLTPLLPTPQTAQVDLPHVQVVGEHEEVIADHPTTGLIGVDALPDGVVASAEQNLPSDAISGPAESRKRRQTASDERTAKRRATEMRMDQGRVMQPGLLPYVCGRASCWPASSPVSESRYDTARELAEHMRRSHAGQASDDVEKPYRCGLSGCGKAWKNLNGLQYHLQVAEAHYKKAMMSKAKVMTATSGDSETPTPPEDPGRRTYRCLEPDCGKVYGHASGLRYHRIHVHQGPLPEQLSILPPSVEKKVPRKARQYRRSATRPSEAET
ncbi:hypothetical protein FB107DRAFT_285703 [Schizophyllum commune]